MRHDALAESVAVLAERETKIIRSKIGKNQQPNLIPLLAPRTTEVVYRRELPPILTAGAEAMDKLFNPRAS
jgi:hypothetical protein